MDQNVSYKLEEKITNKTDDEYMSCDSLYEEFLNNNDINDMPLNEGDINETIDIELALNLDYNTNYKLNQITLIADYYSIDIKESQEYDDEGKKKRRKNKKKEELVSDIVKYELDIMNDDIVEHRKLLWHYIYELKNDEKLSKYICL
tara:strand:+ start:171 stop:611 length:441 start_codon:yes stop_codon:yes gene_type:complete